MPKPTEPTKQHTDLATYIAEWLQRRNGGELRSAIMNMRVGDYNLMIEELAFILANDGKPPNWQS